MSDHDALSKIPYERLGAVGEYLLDCRDRAMRPRTVLLKHERLAAMRAAVGVDLTELDDVTAKRWWRSLTRRSLKPRTRAIYLSHARAFYTWAIREDLVVLDPTRKLQMPKCRIGVPRDLDPAAVIAVLGLVPQRTRLAMCLMLWCGLRCAEVSAVRGQDVVSRGDDDAVLRVRGKGGAERIVKLPGWLAGELREPGPGWLFGSGKAVGDPLHPSTIGRMVAEALRAGGIDATAHQLRHTFATSLYRSTRDVLLVQASLGHATLATAQVYARAVGLETSVVEGLFSGAGAPARLAALPGGEPGHERPQPGLDGRDGQDAGDGRADGQDAGEPGQLAGVDAGGLHEHGRHGGQRDERSERGA